VPTDVIMPKVDMVMDAGTVVSWYRQENEAVTAGEPLLVIETDKSTIDVEAPASGVLAAVVAHPGDTVPVAQRLALILAPGEALPPSKDTSSEAAPAAEAVSVAAAPRPRATPAARAIARQHQLDLASLSGSGPQGRLRKEDVLAALSRHSEPGPAQETAPAPPTVVPVVPPTPAPAHISNGTHEDGELLPLSGVRRVVAERLTQSAAIPAFTLNADVEMSAVLRLRERLPFKPSVTAVIARAVATLLIRHPTLNSSFRPEGIWQHRAAHLGIALDSDGRLLVPVIREANRLNLREIHETLGTIRERAAARQLGPAELQGSTFSISNLGMLGVDAFTAVINPPEAAILAVGRTVERPVGREGMLVLRPMCTLTLSVDHRVADGAAAARFLGDLRAAIEEPYLLL
jgi:pyruvate dehydrogenase E2 component (dihydrolipoamide acetyltransferase)